MKNLSFALTCALFLGVACGSGSGGDAPGGSGGSTSGGMSGVATGGESASGGVASGGSGAQSSTGGVSPASGGEGGASPSGENDPYCPEELPEHESACSIYPFVVCSYEGATTPLGDNCVCAAFSWDCMGCPAEPIHGELDCTGYEGEACGGCSCSSEGNSNWDCGDIFP